MALYLKRQTPLSSFVQDFFSSIFKETVSYNTIVFQCLKKVSPIFSIGP
jgi:hypothetical protein